MKRKHPKWARHGGKAIASGSYGCVFNPAVKCQGQATRSNGISKMMQSKYAMKEYAFIDNLRKVVVNVPDNSKYFILSNVSLCSPGRLDREDLQDFDKKCKSITKKDITANTVNEHLNEYRLINQPHGGEDLSDYIDTMFKLESPREKIAQFVALNNTLINLLVNGIVPMNKLGLLHNDIKNDNVLRQPKDGLIRLIDWNLSTIFDAKSGNAKPPQGLFGYPIVVNRPLASFLFDNHLNLNDVLNQIRVSGSAPASREGLLNKVSSSVLTSVIKESPGHYPFIRDSILPKVSKDSVAATMINNVSAVLDKFMNPATQQLDLDAYFQSAYKYNADIVGWLIIYVQFIEKPYVDVPTFNNELRNIYYDYIYSPRYAVAPIPIDELVGRFKNLNRILLSSVSTAGPVTKGGRTRRHRQRRSKTRRHH
jgi:serine/threonine protein kinase